jgi:hypothetical protein
MRILIILVIAALGLAGCNANQGVNASPQAGAGHFDYNNPYNPIDYAQNNTGHGGGR